MISIDPNNVTTDWHEFAEYGSFFRLGEGALWVCQMRDDGSREDRPLKVLQWKSGHNARHGRTIGRIVAELLAHGDHVHG